MSGTFDEPAADLGVDSEADLEAERLALLELLLEEEAEEAAAAGQEGGAAEPPAAAPERIPLSLSQRRLWIADRLDPGTPLFNIPASQRLHGPLDRRALFLTLQHIVDRHEALRTTFSVGESEPGGRGPSEGFQVIARRREIELPRIDLGAFSLRSALKEAVRLSGREQARGFDLERGPLLRLALVEMAPDDNVLLTTMHHIIADGWSLAIFQREFVALYAGYARGLAPELPALPIQYADFALWQRDWLRGEVLEKQLAFWREHLAGAPFLAELPTDRPRPRVRNFRGGKASREVADSVAEAFHRLARGEGVTYFASALALGHAWLGRLSVSDDALIGSPIAGRHRIETEGVIGFFVSNLVFRAQLRGDPTAREVLVRTREETLAILSHQDVPFDLLVEALAPERDLSTTPVYQVQLMAFDVLRRPDAAPPPDPAREREAGDLGLSPLLAGDEMSLFDLSMSVAEGGRRLALQYNSDLFDPATAERLVGYFENLMLAFIAEPDRRFSEIAMIGEGERRQLLLEWNPPLLRALGGAFERLPLLPELVAAHARSRPGAIAVEMGEDVLTYAELDERSDALARYLAMFGVGAEVRVGLCLERSLDLVVGLIAVQKAGGAYLPLDPSYPIERLAAMIEDAGLMLLIAHDATLDALPAGTAYVINLDRKEEMAALMGDGAGSPAGDTPLPGPAPEHLAYVIYTSGSTGRPKGVLLAHDGLANLCAEQAEIFAVGPESRVLQFASVSFDASVAEIAVALRAGAALVLATRDELSPGPGLVRLLKDRRITKATIPPSALAVLPAGSEGELPDLATLVVAGEACSPDLAALWSRGRRFVNAYGPTEATVCAAAEVYAEHRALTLGGPLAGVEIHVLGPRFEPLPAGVRGELLIGGRGLARGYLNRPDLTAERFVPHPFAAERGDSGDPGARLYRTGDLVRRLIDGRVEFLGRIDHQVKVRGYRIELGEVEAALRAQAGVKDVVVLARNDSGGGLSGGNADRLVAYLLAEPDCEPVPAELKAALASRLPDYMIPAAFVSLSAFPLTSNGKVDRKALPAPELAHLHVAGAHREAPRDAIESLVAEIFAEVLSLPGEISIHDSFFDLGGHSLLATQLLSRVRDAFEIELPLRQVFEAQTVASFARAIEKAQREARGLESGPIEPRPREEGTELPLSFAQERLWFLDQLEPGSPTYNIPTALKVRGALDPGLLLAALRHLERRHESLRTTFPTRAGRAIQQIAPPDSDRGALLFARVDLGALATARGEIETLRLAAAEAVRPFDLVSGPLGRVVLVHLAPPPAATNALLLTVHHIISDGWSMGVFVRELAEVHSALVERRPPDPKLLPPLPIQYADFAAWQRGWLSGEVLARQIEHWRAHLLGAPELLALPTDRPRPAIQSYRGASVARPSAPGTVERLHAFSRGESATLFMTLLAVWSSLLYRYTGQTDVPVGTPIANRNRAEVEGLLGFFVNTLVLRTRVVPRGSFRSLLVSVRESTLEGYAHQDLPFEKLVEAIAPERNLSYSPLFQSMLVLQNNPDRPLELPGLELSGLGTAGEVSKYDLTLNAIEVGSRLACRLVYSAALFEPATVERLLGHLHALLEAVLEEPDRPVGSLDFFAPEERRTLLVEWNRPAVEHPTEGYLPQMFEAQVDAGPERVAVEFDDPKRAGGEPGKLTYAELDERANRLARHLRALGVGPETRVGVCLERSLDLPVALLAVLKAGAAYLPLDPTLPEDRLRYLVDDAAAPVVLTASRFVDRLGSTPEGTAGPRLVLLDDPGEAASIAAESPERLLPAALSEHPAYVIYTSGSTGKPKGVVITHRALGNRLRYAVATDFQSDGEAFLQKTTISFDVSVLEIFAPLVSGGRTVLPEPEGHRDPAYLVRLIAERRITQASFPPSTLALLLDSGALDDCRDLRLLVTGGETVPADLPGRVRERLPWIDVFNRYGPTEATISVTSWLCRPEAEERSLPIGRPTAGALVYLLDREGEPVPVGVPGELHLGGLCLARGYLGRPETTAAAFVPNPFYSAPGERLYATGDLAKWRADGAIEFVGRIDGQIKIRGFRVELGEIEAALHRLPGVREAAVIDREDAPGQKRLVAYFVAEPDTPADLPRTLRDRLAEALPAYMVPAAFVPLARLPLSPTGKVDRRALPAPPAEATTAEGYAPPRTEAEALLAGIWAEVLGLSRVGIHDNYFALGGDSILSIQIVARAAEAGCRIAPRQLFQHQTVAELAAVAGTVETVEAEQGTVEGAAPLSPIQRWFFASERPDRHWFNQSFLLGIDRAVESTTVERAVARLVEHHDALRLRFEKLPEGWRQELAPVGDTPFAREDLSALPAEERRAALEAKCAALQSSLDLENGPILRAALFDLGESEPRRLLLAIHHLAIDGVSWRILLEDLERLLSSRDLPPKTTSWKSWTEKLAASATAFEADAGFWLARPETSFRLPVESGGANLVSSAQSVAVAFDVEETRRLLEAPAAYRAQIQDLLLAALEGALSGDAPVAIELEGHGREEDLLPGVDLTRTVGWFTTLYPVVLDAPAGAGPGERLRSVKERLRTIPGRGLSYGLLRWLGRPETRTALAAFPHPEISFNYLGQADSSARGAGAAASSALSFARENPGPTLSPRAERSHELAVSAVVSGGTLRVEWIFGSERLARATVESWAAAFRAEALRIAEHCASPEAGGYTPSDFPLAGADQETLDRLFAADRTVEDVYPLAPLQEGMVFQTLAAPHSGVYYEQLEATLSGPFDDELFGRALARVLERHPILRTSFRWQGTTRLLQVVHSKVATPLSIVDWRDLPAEEIPRRFAALLEADRRAGFALDRAPLVAARLVRTGENERRLVLANHHAILDGWSYQSFTSELFALYAGLRAGREPELPHRRPFRDFIAWLESRDRGASERYWRRALAGFREPTPLVVDRPAPPGRTGHEAGAAERSLPRSVGDALEALARREQVTLNTVVQAATGLLFARYSGHDDVVFGTAVSGRPPGLPGIESMLGLFLNTLPARIVSSPETTLGLQLRDVQDRQLEMREHEHSSLVDVHSWSEVEPGRPLFQAILVFESYPRDRAVAASAATETGGEPFAAIRDVGFEERTNLPLALVAAPLERLFLRASFDADRFDPATAERLLDHLENLLSAMADSPQATLAELRLLAPAEAAMLTAVPAPAGEAGSFCLHRRFERAASERPLAPAVTFGAETLLYGDLDRASNRLARRLRALGVGAETRVALCFDRTPEILVAILAVLKAGGAYVPLDPAYPAERLAFILADAEAPVVISRSELAAALPESGAHRLLLDLADLESESAAPLDEAVSPDNAAYVIYTSGSTGRPKGVVVTHANVARLFRATDRWFGFGADDVWTLFHSYAFDFSVWEIWGALLYGGRLVVVPYAVSRSPRDFRALLADQRVTVLNQTPSAFHQLQRADEEAGPADLPLALRTVVFGGEALDLGALKPWFARHPADRPRLVNMYGIPETCVHVTYRPIGSRDLTAGSVIGEAIPDLGVRLLDARGDLVPVGVPGEIHVVGEGLARGYLARPDLTAERFVPDAFAQLPGQRSYRSGDLARWRSVAAGGALDLEYLGRIDFQVKIRGFRIELGEIEAALSAHPEVREAVVVVRGEGDDRRLVAYLVPAGGATPSNFEAELREHLRSRLPEHMLPAFLVPLAVLPLTPNGKVDKKALPAPEIDLGIGLAPPESPVERRLAEIWEGLLGVSGVGLDSDFFALGGHSLLAMRLSSHVRDALGLEIPVTLVFEQPTLRGFAREVEKLTGEPGRKDDALAGAGTEAGLPLVAIPRHGPVPLSYAQARLWLFDRVRPGNTFYNLGGAQPLGARLRLDLLAEAVAVVVRRHESLRTSFAEIDLEPVQVVHPEVEVRPRLIDLSALSSGAAPGETARLSRLQVGLPFDLARPPLLRFWLVRQGAAGDALLYMMHHIISDGWSLGILISELSAAYDALALGKAPDLPGLPVQYPDFAVWQRAWFEQGELDRQLAYWRGRLAGSLPTELPADRQRPAVSTFRGRRFRAALGHEVAGALHALGREHRASAFMVLLAGFSALLDRWSGREEIVVGTPIANRQRREVEGLIGFFINTLVLRTDLSGDPSFGAAIERTKETALGAFANQDLPFERLVEELAPRREAARHPLFQISFNLINTPTQARRSPESAAGQAAASPSDGLEAATALFDLQLSAVEAADSFQLYWEYSVDLFEEATIRRFARGFEILLASAAARPEVATSQLAWLSEEEMRQLAVDPAETPIGAPFCLHERFAELAAARPSAPALTFGDQTLSYAEVDARANRLARRLRSLGVGVETRVALCLDRTLDLPIAILAVLKAGGAYVPLDPTYPSDRLGFVLADAETPVVLTTSDLGVTLPESGARIVQIDQEDLASESPEPPDGGATLANAAYVIYTSGSTGRPKGVVVTHENAALLFRSLEDFYGFGPDDVWTLFHSYAFDYSVWEMWGAWAYGARLVVVPVAISRSVRDFRRLLADEKVTVLNQTPSAFHQLQRADEAAGPDAAPLSVRIVNLGGEALEFAALAPWFARYPEDRPRLVNLYGITETTVIVTYRPIGRGETRSGSAIGVPIADLAVRLLDASGHLVPLGVPGEIHIAGAGLARGYLARPALTAERFLPDPFSRVPGARSYRSGDLARWRPAPELPGGLDLEYLGRIDHQVKIRGFRLELGEIEAALLSHPDVREAVVVARGERDDMALIAYLVPGAPADLRDHLRGRLPEYMMPAHFVDLAALPLTPNGKVDKKALPAPEIQLAEGSSAPPRTFLERRLAAIWEALLGVSGVGLDSEFFDLGGHSLLAMRMASRIREELGFDLPVQAVFEEPTLGALAARMAADPGLAADGAPPLVARPRSGPLPVSFAQARLWLLDRLMPGNPFYNIGGAHRLGGRLRADRFAAAVDFVVRRHESLRTSFGEVELEPIQIVHPRPEVRPRQIDLGAIPSSEAESLRLGALQVAMPFELSRAPLLRLWLVRLPAEDVLHYVIHHIVSDAWSIGVLVSELTAAYAAIAAGGSPRLPDLPVQYADYALWQHEWFERGELARQLDYWRTVLSGAPATELPTDRPRPPVATYRGRRFLAPLDRALEDSLRQVSRERQASPFMVLLAAFEGLVSRYVGQEDVVVGMPIANRQRSEVEGLIGFFVNTLVLRTDLSGSPTFSTAVERIRDTALGAFAHPDLPFERLVEELSPQRDLARNPLFQLMFNLVDTRAAADRGAEGARPVRPIRPQGGAERSHPANALFDLQVYVVETADAFDLNWEWASDLFEEATIRRLARSYQTLLGEALARREVLLSELPLLAAPERSELIAAGTGGALGVAPLLVHEAIAAQAERTPAAIAVVAGAETLTYTEMVDRANRLSRRLRRLGVGVESRVGIAVERSLALPVATLGVLGAGASYVPLDPAYPAERLAYMAADAGLAAVIVSEGLDDPARFAGYAPIAMPITLLGTVEGELDSSPIPSGAVAENLAYTIYTSGSTGKPKGVELSHGALANFLASMIERPGVSASDVLVAVTSLSFDIAGLELYAPLCVGARTVIARQEEVMGGALLGDLLARSGATLLQSTPSGWRVLLGSGWPGDPKLKALVGGEALPPALASELRGKVGALWNMYGPTETAVWSAIDEVGEGPISIGRPIAATGLYAVDAHGGLLPSGVPGELWIGGAGVARGYHGRPDLTAERFLPDAYSGRPGARLYRTGDLARRLADGRFECLGRIDNQVKVRGFRIELGEIESVLAAHPHVAQSVVVARALPGAEPELVAYFVAKGEEGEPAADAPAAAELRAHLKERLPDYMVPAWFVRLEALPTTPNGKVDRRALPDPARGARAGAGGEAPGTEMERRVASIWSAVLHLPEGGPGLDDDFFDLGGHSLVALKVQAQLERDLGQSVPLVLLFRHPTVRQLAAALEAKARQAESATGRSNVLVPIQSRGTRAPLFVLPPIGGTVYFYRALAQALGPDQPVWGLQAPGLEGDEAPIDNLEAMAAFYLEAIAPVRKAGAPVHLAGASMGGLVAFEMARQLAGRGEPVGMTALLDTTGGSATAAIDDRAALMAMVHMLTEGRFRIPAEELLGLSPDEQIDRVFAEAAARGVSTEGVSRDRIARLRRVIEANLKARAGYREQPYEGNLLFCRAEIRLPGEVDRPETFWFALAQGGVEVFDVPGDHESMLQTPNVERLAEILARKLEE